MPINVPAEIAMPTLNKLTDMDMRAPKINRLSTSRPSSSVPRICLLKGGVNFSATSIAVGL